MLNELTNAQTWQKIEMNFPPGDTLLTYSSISFATKNIGWVHTTGNIDADHRLTKIFKTRDGGHNWVRQYIDSLDSGNINFVIDSLHYWTIVVWGNLLISTTNGGDKWESTDISDYKLRSIYFFDEKKGIALSETRPWFTTDGGKSWEAGNSSHVIIGTLDFVDSNKGWSSNPSSPVATDAGSIAITIDGGKTWMYQDSLTAVLLGIDFADSLVGYAVGTNGKSSTGFIYSTINGGNEWTHKQFLGSGPMLDVGFLNSQIGWTIGESGKIWQTTDGGNNWNIQKTNTDATLGKITVLRKEKAAYVFGGATYGYGSVINPFILLYADLSNISDVNKNDNNIPLKYYLSQNHPNPFNPTTLINYQLPISGHVILKVYDMLGKEIAKLVDEEKIAGDYKVTFNGSNLSSGVYFYRMTAGDFVQTKKIILLK
jgi:photosystem II stability/assembly factor-like uncharacterized protein